MRQRIAQTRNRGIKYDSVPTRYTSLQHFLGGAEFNEKLESPELLPIDECSNLERKFNSGANRTDIPSQYGPASVDRRLAGVKLSVADDWRGWFRNKGEPSK